MATISQNTITDRRLGLTGMVSSSVMFSLMAGLVRYGDGIDASLMSMARFVVGLMMTAGLLLGGTARLTFINVRLLILRGLLGGLGVMIFYVSIVEIGLARGTVITYSYPIFAAIGGSLLLKERLSPRHWSFIALAFIGLFLTIRDDAASASPIGVAWFNETMTAVNATGIALVFLACAGISRL